MGYLRQCQHILPQHRCYYTIPYDVIDLCVWFYATERFRYSTPWTSTSASILNSDQGVDDIVLFQGTRSPSTAYDSIIGSHTISPSVAVKAVHWRFRVVSACPMRIGITADLTSNDDSLWNISGKHRFYTISYLGVIASHKQHNRVCPLTKDILIEGDVVRMVVNLDEDNIQFTVDQGLVRVVEETVDINLCDQYKMVMYIGNFRACFNDDSVGPTGTVRLEHFEIEYRREKFRTLFQLLFVATIHEKRILAQMVRKCVRDSQMILYLCASVFTEPTVPKIYAYCGSECVSKNIVLSGSCYWHCVNMGHHPSPWAHFVSSRCR